MGKLLKCTLSPSFDTYMGRNDLERELGLANLSQLMPSDKGARRAFFRTINQCEEAYGVHFKVVKETRRDIVWSIHLGRRNLGSYMVIFRHIKGQVPTFAGSKFRIIDKTRTPEDERTFLDICATLNDTLLNPGVNAYTFHLRVLEYMRSIADVIEPRETGLTHLDKEVKSWYFYVDESHRSEIEWLSKIYSKFKMRLEWKEVTL